MSTDDDTIEQPEGEEHPDLREIRAETNVEVLRERCVSLFRHNGKLLNEKKRAVQRVRGLEAIEAARQAKPDHELSARDRLRRDAERRLAKLSVGSEEYEAALAELDREADERIAIEARREFDTWRDAWEADYTAARRASEAQRLVIPIAQPETASLLASHVKGRIDVSRDEGGQWTTTYRSKGGHPCSAEELVAELRAEPGLGPLIRGGTALEKANHAKRVAETLGLAPPAKQH